MGESITKRTWEALTPEARAAAVRAYHEDKKDYLVQLTSAERSFLAIVLDDALDYDHWSEDPEMLSAFDALRKGLGLMKERQ